MRVLHLSTTDTAGGAAKAAYRLQTGFQSEGIDSRMLVQRKESDDSSVYAVGGRAESIHTKVRGVLDQLPVKRYHNRDSGMFSPAWLPERRAAQISRHNPDIVHLHWINSGFMKPETISRIDVPVVWTFHDMWPFTGGCHYSKSCQKYRSKCGACPHINSEKQDDLANNVWRRKWDTWDNYQFVIVTPSRWMETQAQDSSLVGNMQIERIPYCIDLDTYSPVAQKNGFNKFSLDESKRYILFGATNDSPRKGSDLLIDALNYFQPRTDIEVIVFGDTDIDLNRFAVPVQQLGWLSRQDLQLAYAAADVTVVPSRQDNLPNIALESIASGTPVVGFDIGGLPDIVEHRYSGYLADPFDVSDLAYGINWVLASPDRTEKLGQRARDIAEETFSVTSIVRKYKNLFSKMI